MACHVTLHMHIFSLSSLAHPYIGHVAHPNWPMLYIIGVPMVHKCYPKHDHDKKFKINKHKEI